MAITINPVIFGSEPDQHAGRLPVAGNHDLFFIRQLQAIRKLILDFSKEAAACYILTIP